MRRELEGAGLVVEKMESEYRPTPADEGGVKGWVGLMGRCFLEAVRREKGEKASEEAERKIGEVLESVCTKAGGGETMGYVRLRVLCRKA